MNDTALQREPAAKPADTGSRPSLETFTQILWDRGKTKVFHGPEGDVHPTVAIGHDPAQQVTVVEWELRTASECRLLISPNLLNPARIEFVAKRLGGVLGLLGAFYSAGAPGRGRIGINLEDHTVVPGLSFCDHNGQGFLVPDPYFLDSYAYREVRRQLASGGPPWEERKAQAVWRGASSGLGRGNWHVLPRIHLSQLSQRHPDLIDAGITHVVQLPPEAKQEIADAGLMRTPIPPHTFAEWRYQIDIDGNTNSWPGLFQKLLTGSPVIKIASKRNWRQWYYDRLEPWVNFVPADTSLGNLAQIVKWLNRHESRAIDIGRAGRELALSMTYESEINRAIPVISAAFEAAPQEKAVLF